MKRTRAQHPKLQEPNDPTTPKPQRRSKQPKQPKAVKKPAEPGHAAAAVAPAVEAAATVPDVGASGEDVGAQTMEWDLDIGLNESWWTWGVEEEKLLGWFPFVEEDFLCLASRGDAEVAFDDDIWRIHQIYEIPNSTEK